MMLRQSEMEAKKRDMKRLFDPRSDIIGPSDSDEREETEERREIDQVETSQRDSVGTTPEASRVRRRGPGP
jgi:hypothetical protein